MRRIGWRECARSTGAGAAALALGMAGTAMAQPDAPVVPPPPAQAAPIIPDLAARLSALSPERPLAYYELGEEVADEAKGPADITLARQLFILAYELDRAAGSADGLGPSVCLALAQVERLDEMRAWLRATAGTLDPRYASTNWNVAPEPAASDLRPLRAAEVLGLTRAGESEKALATLDQPGVRALLLEYEPLLGVAGQTGGLHRLEMQIRAWPCPECHNRRWVNRVERDGPVIRICGTCNGNPGPELDQAELISHLRFESRLLSGVQRSWSAQAAADYGSPLLDPDPDQLGPTLRGRYGIVLGRPYWRAGEWTDRPDSSSRPEPEASPERAPATQTGSPGEPEGAPGH